MVRKMVATCFSLALALFGAAAATAQQILVVSPAVPTSADQLTVFLTVPACAFRVTSAVQGSTVFLFPDTSLPCPPLAPPNPGVETAAKVGPLSAGSYTIVVVTDGKTTDSCVLFVQQPATQLSLVDGRYAVSVTWTNRDGTPGGSSQAVQLSDASGYFWFFDSSEVELTVKLVNGLAVNARYWVFVASATDVPFTLSVIDTWLCGSSTPVPGCPARTFEGLAGINRNFFDFTTFPFA